MKRIIAAVLGLLLFARTAPCGPLQTDPSKRNKEWICVVPTQWASAVQPLVTLRASEGRSTAVWTFDDLLGSSPYAPTPSGLRNALKDAWNTWSTRPRWVVIFADARVGEGFNYTAGRLGNFSTPCPGLGIGDTLLWGMLPMMDVDGDSLPDIAVGRVPAITVGDVTNYITKVSAHDNAVQSRLASHASLALIGDENVFGNDSAWVRTLADSLYSNFDGAASQARVYYSASPCCGAAQRGAAIAGWNTAPDYIVAMGNESNWYDMAGFFQACSSTASFGVNDLAATPVAPALLWLSCAGLATDAPTASSCDALARPLAEQLLLSSTRGASVVIGPMRQTVQYWNFLIGKWLLVRKASNDYTWGAVYVNETVRSWTLGG